MPQTCTTDASLVGNVVDDCNLRLGQCFPVISKSAALWARGPQNHRITSFITAFYSNKSSYRVSDCHGEQNWDCACPNVSLENETALSSSNPTGLADYARNMRIMRSKDYYILGANFSLHTLRNIIGLLFNPEQLLKKSAVHQPLRLYYNMQFC